MSVSSYTTVEKPDHVSEEAVIDFDYLHPEGLDTGTVYDALARLQEGPDIRWTPRNGGHWIVTRFDDVKWVQENYQIFSHEYFTIPRESVTVKMPPLTVDPPLHARYRAIFNPFFTPSRIAVMKEKARELTIELTEKIRQQGQCEFREEFAQVMPVVMFLGIVDLPLERREEFISLGLGYMHATDVATRESYARQIGGYLGAVLEQRYHQPGTDILSAIAKWRDNPRFAGDYEMIGMAMLIFFGGLDTVANLLSFVAWHLALNPEHRRRLVEEPAVIPRAVEEYFRRFGLSNTGRLILSDVKRKGETMKKDEMIMVPIGLSSLDDRVYPDPFTVDFDRDNVIVNGQPAHNTFGNGPHKCVGSPLARAELSVFLEEWPRRMPDFSLDPARPPRSHMGSVNGVEHLHLVWAA